MVKFLQGTLIQLDNNYFFNERKASVHSSNLTEELGIVDFVFSDKTGTLTCNIMKFKALSVFGTKYGNQAINGSKMISRPSQIDLEEVKPILNQTPIIQENDSNGTNSPNKRPSPNVDFYDPSFTRKIEQEVLLGSSKVSREFNEKPLTTVLTLLSLCHTVITETFQD
jgi:phospholipid-transporting ATPase